MYVCVCHILNHFKVYSSVVLNTFYCYANITTIHLQNFSFYTAESPFPLNNDSLS